MNGADENPSGHANGRISIENHAERVKINAARLKMIKNRNMADENLSAPISAYVRSGAGVFQPLRIFARLYQRTCEVAPGYFSPLESLRAYISVRAKWCRGISGP
jgi:hypothetical protein